MGLWLLAYEVVQGNIRIALYENGKKEKEHITSVLYINCCLKEIVFWK